MNVFSENATISICIPTCNRPEMLAEALESCRVQTYEPLEVVIGDDSSDGRSEEVVERFRKARDWTISYRRNVPGLGQNANVRDLFARATGDRIILLHDDDRLLPDAVPMLDAPWHTYPGLVVTFGRQAIITTDGSRDDDATAKLNIEFERTGPSRILNSSMLAGLLQQFPNNGFLISSEFARTIGYRDEATIGTLCDVDFSIRACAEIPTGGIYYVDALTAEYRRHDASISHRDPTARIDNAAPERAFFSTIAALPLRPDEEFARARIRSRFIERVLKGFAVHGDRREALTLYCSKEYGWRRRLSIKGGYQLALILAPQLERLRGRPR